MQRMSAQPFAVSRLLELIEWAGLPAETPAVQDADGPAATGTPVAEPVASPSPPVTLPTGRDAAAA